MRYRRARAAVPPDSPELTSAAQGLSAPAGPGPSLPAVVERPIVMYLMALNALFLLALLVLASIFLARDPGTSSPSPPLGCAHIPC